MKTVSSSLVVVIAASVSCSNGIETAPTALSSFDENSDLIGSVAGTFRVDESGAATFSVPISVPAGTAGVAPQLALNYRSQDGNGLLGRGWSLSGVSSIVRCRQTTAIDGQAKAITWSETDRFCLDGERLVLVDGDAGYGGVGAIYKTETDRFLTVTSVDGTLGHPLFFVVEHKDGSRTTYGEAADARQMAGSHVLTWAQDSYADSVGNQIRYHYQSDGGFRLHNVSYAYGSGTTPRATVLLEYEDDRPDPFVRSVAGHTFSTTMRLKQIHAFNGDVAVRTYAVTYRDVTDSDRTSKLDSVRECKDDACLPATSFAWTDTELTLERTPLDSVTLESQDDQAALAPRNADINGDGRLDLIWQVIDWDRDGDLDHQYWFYALATDDGFSDVLRAFHDGTDVSNPYNWDVTDFNADGRADLLLRKGGVWRAILSTPRSDGRWLLSSNTMIETPVTDKRPRFVDINGDGLTDAVTDAGYYLREVDTSQSVSSNHYYNFGSKQTVEWVGTEGLEPADPGWEDCDKWKHGVALPSGTRGILSNAYGDFDGDGQVEVIGYEVRCQHTERFSGFIQRRKAYILKIENDQLVNVGAVPASEHSAMPGHILSDRALFSNFPIHAADLNGDGLPDVVWREGFFTGQGNASKPHFRFLYALNNGNGFGTPVEIGLPANENGAHRVVPQFLDFNADGAVDIAFYDRVVAHTLSVMLWNGATFDRPVEIFDPNFAEEDAHHNLQDVDGDGRLDYVYMDKHTVKVFRGIAAEFPTSVITNIANGMGAQTTIRYESLSRTQHYTQHNAGTATAAEVESFYETLNQRPAATHTLDKSCPALPFKAPMYVVTAVDSTAPAAGVVPGQIDPDAKSRISYYYSDAKIQAAGRGFLGFRTLRTVDAQTQVATVTTYRQDFPFIGYPHTTQVVTEQGHKLSESINEWRLENWNDGAPSAPYRPYINETTEETFDLVDDGATQGKRLQRTVTVNVYDDYDSDGVSDVDQYYGNLSKSWVFTFSTNSQGRTELFRKRTAHYYEDTPFGRRRGLVSRTAVISSRLSQPSIMRRTAFTYYTSEHGNLEGLLQSTVIEPYNPEHRLTTTLQYDEFGNKTTTTRAGQDADGNPVVRESHIVYDSTGRYANKHVNHLGHVTREVIERNEFGSPTIVRDLKGVETLSSYGSLGRKHSDASDTGHVNQTVFRACESACPLSAIYMAELTVAGGGQTREYMDALGRPVREATLGFDGRWSVVDTEYDKLGRVHRKSSPYFLGDAAYWAETTYDVLGRAVRTTVPGIAAPTVTRYSGYTTTITNPHDQTKVETRNSRGELVQVVDHSQGKVTYEYNAEGRLSSVHQAGSPSDPRDVLIRLNYDDRGRKSYLNDPDKGEWHYKYNVFGELIEQRDAKGQVMTMTYDSLGRMTHRRDIDAGGNVESDTEWLYDLARNGLGQLSGVRDKVSGYNETHAYDGFGRRSTTTTCIDSDVASRCFSRKVTYDQYGRPGQRIDSASDGSWTDHGIENLYNEYGYLSGIADATRQAIAVYYKVLSMDPRGRITDFALGNGAVTRRRYDSATGRLQALETASVLSGPPNIQNLRYTWDDLDNLVQRRDDRKDLAENFLEYDALNRLVASQVVGQPERRVRYDSLGNITHKSDVGDYVYSGLNAGPHAVTSTGDGLTYQYDANGNMTADSAGRTIEYTVFDKPDKIAKGDHVTQFAYGPSRKRYMRVDDRATGKTVKLYVGNIEYITHPDGTREVKRYINGNAITSVRYTAAGVKTSESTDYLHHDHLGSLDVVTNGIGSIVAEMSFDAWGQRRDAKTWETPSAPALQGSSSSVTDRGYTGHEMLDDVGLIHMNGRVYDPRLGRFLQADPFVQNASDTQLYNRYSYLRNNPINATDPSGYFIQALFVGAFVGYAAGVAARSFDVPWLTAIAGIIGCATLNPVACGAGFGFGSTLGAGGSFSDAVKNGAIAGASAFAFSYIDTKFVAASDANRAAGVGINFGDTQLTIAQTAQRVTAHAVVGGVTSELEGGKFGHGFVRAGLATAGLAVLKGTYQAAKRAAVGKIEDRLEALACEIACEVFPNADDVEATVHLEDIDLGFPETEILGGAGVRVDLAGPHDAVAVLGWWKGSVNVLSGKVSGDAIVQAGGRKHFDTDFLGFNTGLVELGVTLEVNSRESLSVPHFLGARSLEDAVDYNVIDFHSDWIPLD